MYKNLNAQALGVSGRQSDLIELALTYGFRGIDVDMSELAKRAERGGAEQACRFIESAAKSARLKVGSFELPLQWEGPELDFKAELPQLAQAAEVAARLGATRCYTTVMAASDDKPFNECFEFCRQRITEVAEVLAKHEINLGLRFHAAASHREGREFQFIHQAEPLLTLIKTISASNVGLALDLWDWQVGGGGVDQLQELSADQFVMVRLADVPDGVDLASVQDEQRLLPGASETSLAAAVLQLLGEKDYEGPITAYPHPSQMTGRTRDLLIQETAKSLDEQWKAAGLNKSGKVAVAAAE